MNNEQDFIEDNNNNNNLNNNFNTLPSSTFTLSLPCCAAFTITHARLIRIQQVFLICACILLLFESTGCSPLINTPSSAWHCEVWAGVALFIYLAENIGTWAGAWAYPDQLDGWHPVSITKLVSWFLLMIVSVVMVTWVYPPQAPATEPAGR